MNFIQFNLLTIIIVVIIILTRRLYELICFSLTAVDKQQQFFHQQMFPA